MIESSVPMRNSEWSGVGTVTVRPASTFWTTTWLPHCLASTKPWEARMRQTSRPERTRSLPNGDLDLRHVDLSTKVPVDFLGGGRLEE